jgi:hypothetical protein
MRRNINQTTSSGNNLGPRALYYIYFTSYVKQNMIRMIVQVNSKPKALVFLARPGLDRGY